MKPTLIDVNEIDKRDADDVDQFLVGNKCDLASKKVVSTIENEGACGLPEHEALGGKRQG